MKSCESDNSFIDYENPNYRKLYATLSLTSMIGNGPEFTDELDEGSSANELPNGWEKHEDDNGAYYWHIPSGTIQRQLPTDNCSKSDSIIYYEEENTVNDNISSIGIKDNPSFIVNSLGWLEIEESQFTPTLSPSTIQQCIQDLNTKGAVRAWGKQETHRLFLRIENSCFKLLDLQTNKLLDIQPISSIRVWGVMNDDFAFAAKDNNILEGTSSPNLLKCHVFHCEVDENGHNTAQKISELVKSEMIRIKSSQNNQRPSSLRINDLNISPNLSPSLQFPTPIEEPRKTVVAKYMGKCTSTQATGVNVLNNAIDKILILPDNFDEPYCNSVVLVHISPSTITVESGGQVVLEFRVRYLSFLGISRSNVKNCAFIIQVDDKSFEAHCFECEPSSGAFCKTIEAACKLRFQKCLDAHKQRRNISLEKTKPFSPIANLKNTFVNTFSKLLK